MMGMGETLSLDVKENEMSCYHPRCLIPVSAGI